MPGRNGIWKCFLFFLLCWLFFSVPALADLTSLEKEIARHEQELQELLQQEKELTKKLEELARSETNLAREVEKLSQQITRMEKDVASVRQKILTLEKECKELEKETQGIAREINNKKEKVKKAMVALYKHNKEGRIWECFLNLEDPVSLIESWYLFKKYLQFEQQRIAEFLNKHSLLNAKIEEIKQRIRLENVLKQKMLVEEEKIRKLREARETMLQKIAMDRKQYQLKQQELRKAQKELKAIVSRLQEEIRRAREEAAAQGEPVIQGSLPVPGTLDWPVRGKIIEQFGEHKDPVYGIPFYNPGIDIASPLGTNVVVPYDGVVVLAHSVRGYGNTVIIDHQNSMITVYAHLQSIAVKAGDRVKKGDVLGKVGNSGLTEQPVLHFEIRVGNDAREENPLRWLKKPS
ncbi:MAG: peptidoglycan DD-metalloendopeptidase family protein [Candidatus Atribacteria bacterium]|nr:peptidoglycan DD-metalloendopeptidase family protein [Candidatus Atribacteria bacterium]MCD6350114.1 peptidoglycan DD-metalloendopeptidase family protein [Candidatus Atribacteria bacterium]